MDYLRWILLAVGIVIIVAVYFWSRSRKTNRDYSPLDAANEVPSFSAKESTSEWVEGVGPVRVVSKDEFADVIPEINSNLEVESEESVEEDTVESEEIETEVPEEYAVDQVSEEATAEAEETDNAITEDDVVSLFVVADRGEELKGEQILSSTFAAKLEYGDMNIFHRKDQQGKIMFSMANMLEPGWFDFEKMHEIKTRGITLFTQLSLCTDPVESLDEMLVCAHSLATMLNGQLCDQNRQLLNETMAKSLREKAKYFASLKQGHLV